MDSVGFRKAKAGKRQQVRHRHKHRHSDRHIRNTLGEQENWGWERRSKEILATGVQPLWKEKGNGERRDEVAAGEEEKEEELEEAEDEDEYERKEDDEEDDEK